ncbi:hypothetical protein [Flavobacterium sp. GT3R68]|uniref:hypothetical protein n=1 Tax=Flavobacterium sp. GT3R68 TaxID=2594437 RepID=UPI000F875EC8|nr:hypothetical protein [Flavobacterium sp. GT3R68]RTY90578.1 hypothetical protein EKL32_20365 [Flavobacterium sp. GSN2]TRW89896.1 hypothetical protein FNW07_12700 [Flavobacterium sp. GT3R68]
MKKSTVYLAIAVAAFANLSHATAITNVDGPGHFTSLQVRAALSNKMLTETVNSEPKDFTYDEEITTMDPAKVISLDVNKPIEELIKENNLITESAVSHDVTFLYIEKSAEDLIAEDNQIIESTISDEVQPFLIDKTIEEIIAADNQIIESNLIDIQPLDQI